MHRENTITAKASENLANGWGEKTVPTALIVEDNAMNRKLLRDILEIEFTVLEAESAEEADRIMASGHPDVIFMDLQLPGIDGLSYTHKLKQDPKTAPIPVVAVSAHAMQENIDLALKAGCVEYVTKPLTEDPFRFAERMARLAERARE